MIYYYSNRNRLKINGNCYSKNEKIPKKNLPDKLLEHLLKNEFIYCEIVKSTRKKKIKIEEIREEDKNNYPPGNPLE